MMKLSYVFSLLIVVILFSSCGDNRYEWVEGYIPSGAEANVNFEDKDLHVPTCEISVVAGKDTLIANARVMSMFPGRYLVFYHHKHPLFMTDSIFVRMTLDKNTGRYEITAAGFASK